MSSRRSSSRKSESRASRASHRSQQLDKNEIQKYSANNILGEKQGKKKPLTLPQRLIMFILILLFNGSIIYYLYNIKDASCNCIYDWRPKFIIAMSILGVFMGLVKLFISGSLNKSTQSVLAPLALLNLILGIVNIYAFFTYIGDLQTTKCACAIDKQPVLNWIMNFLRWAYVIGLAIGILAVIVMIIFLGYLFKTK